MPTGCFLNQAQGALPAAANAIAVTSGSHSVKGAYTTIAASAPSDLAISGLVYSPGSGFTTNGFVAAFVAGGAAGSEVDVAAFVGFTFMASGTYTTDNARGSVITNPIPNESITSGTRISVAIQFGDHAETHNISLLYIGLPIAGDIETTTADLTAFLTTTLTSGSSSYANGSWDQLIASTSGDFVVSGFATKQVPAAAGSSEIAVGTGAAASEVEISAFSIYTHGVYAPNSDEFNLLLDNIAGSTRVALRMRHAHSSSQTIWTWMAGYYL